MICENLFQKAPIINLTFYNSRGINFILDYWLLVVAVSASTNTARKKYKQTAR